MKRVGTGQPVLSIGMIVRNAADTLEACLASVRERAPEAEIVIVDTMSSDGGATEAIAKKYADVFVEYTGPKGTWTREMYAFDDAAAARNESFRLATGRWLMWVDADDVLPGPEEVERLLKVNGRWMPSGKVADVAVKPSLTELLVEVERKYPEVEGFYCPYLYWEGEGGVAKTWQTRERIVKNDGNWHWQRPAHELLVPKNPESLRHLATLAHLLFRHTKKFTHEDKLFSLKRHHAILKPLHDAGTASCQDYLYLINYAQFVEPAMEEVYLNHAYELAHTSIDRARVLVQAGNIAKRNGFFHDAVEAFTAAGALQPEYADAHYGLAQVLEEAERHFEAGQAYQRAAECGQHPLADSTPRAQMVQFRVQAALAYMEAARRATHREDIDGGIAVASQAVKLINDVLAWPGLGDDRMEASNWARVIANERDGLVRMQELEKHWTYLTQNDETQKAMAVVRLIPHNQQNHPFVTKLKPWLAKMRAHLHDPNAYTAFYEGLEESDGVVPSKEEHLTMDKSLPRTRFLLRWLAARPDATVLEVGAFDGNIAIPLLRAHPSLHYTVVEAQTKALERLKERVQRFGLAERVETFHGTLSPDGALPVPAGVKYDAVVLYEVIEHVQSVESVVKALLGYVKPGGRLFLSTPWGAFDRGHPMEGLKREPRGHVRALMPEEFFDRIEDAGGVVEEMGGCHDDTNYGDTMHLRVKCVELKTQAIRQGTCVEFAVPSALWDWNATHVEETGIGASEETIVNLARGLAKDEQRSVIVRGPIPRARFLFEEEAKDCVRYHPRESMHRTDSNATVIVSRAPSFGRVLDEKVGKKLDKLLWLQDATYPDLNASTAADYRKVVVLSEWHKKVMHENHGVPLAHMEVIPNFLLAEHFTGEGPKREAHRFIYSSSPDRGLITLLKMWPAIRAKWPDATLGIFYGWEGCMKLGGLNPEWNARYRPLRKQYLQLRGQPGVEEYGRVNHQRIAMEMRRSSVWLYPTTFEETYASNALKARAAGCIPVCTPLAALNESAVDPTGLNRFVPAVAHFETWTTDCLNAVEAVIDTPEERRQRMAEAAIEAGRLEAIQPRWERLLAR